MHALPLHPAGGQAAVQLLVLFLVVPAQMHQLSLLQLCAVFSPLSNQQQKQASCLMILPASGHCSLSGLIPLCSPFHLPLSQRISSHAWKPLESMIPDMSRPESIAAEMAADVMPFSLTFRYPPLPLPFFFHSDSILPAVALFLRRLDLVFIACLTVQADFHLPSSCNAVIFDVLTVQHQSLPLLP